LQSPLSSSRHSRRTSVSEVIPRRGGYEMVSAIAPSASTATGDGDALMERRVPSVASLFSNSM